MMQLYVFILVVFIGIATSSVEDNKIDAVSREFQKALGQVASETNFVKLFNEEKTALDVVEILRKSNVTVKKFFSIGSWDGVEHRSNLPGVSDYIRGKVNTFHQLELPIAFKLLGKVGQLLRVAYAGCNGFECSKAVIRILSRYQNLVRDASTFSEHFVYVCIRSLKFHRYSHYYLTKKKLWTNALKLFKRTIPLALSIKKESEEIIRKTRILRRMSKEASLEAIDESLSAESEKGKLKKKIRGYENLRDSLEIDVERAKKEADDIGKLAIQMKEKEEKVETMKELERRRDVLSVQCNKVNRNVFRRVCRTMTSWWGLVRTRRCRYVRGQITDVVCRRKINQLLVQFKRDRLRELSKRLQVFRSKRIEYEQGKLAVLSNYNVLFRELGKTAIELEALKGLSRVEENILQFAIVSLSLATQSMIIVQVQLVKMIDFWDGVVQHTKFLARRASDKTTDQSNIFEEKLFESGFSWLALAKVLRIAAMEMKMTMSTVDNAFMNLPTTDEVKLIIDVEGKNIIKETLALSQKHDKAMMDTKAKIKKIKQDKKKESDVLNMLHNETEDYEDDMDEMDEKYDIMKN